MSSPRSPNESNDSRGCRTFAGSWGPRRCTASRSSAPMAICRNRADCRRTAPAPDHRPDRGERSGSGRRAGLLVFLVAARRKPHALACERCRGEPEPLHGRGRRRHRAGPLQRWSHPRVHQFRNEWRLVTTDPATWQPRVLVQRRTEVLWPRFSPDGSSIAFFGRGQFGDVQIFVVSAEGRDVRQLTQGRGQMNSMPRWRQTALESLLPEPPDQHLSIHARRGWGQQRDCEIAVGRHTPTPNSARTAAVSSIFRDRVRGVQVLHVPPSSTP